jgi:hypothetical protein
MPAGSMGSSVGVGIPVMLSHFTQPSKVMALGLPFLSKAWLK